MSWIASHEDEVDLALLKGNLVRTVSRPMASLIRMAHRLFQVDAQDPEQLHSTAAEHAARLEILDVVLRTLLPKGDARKVGRPTLQRAQLMIPFDPRNVLIHFFPQPLTQTAQLALIVRDGV